MKFIESFTIAIRALFANKLRSSLTMLGIIIGVGAVITLMSVGRGAQDEVTSMIEGIGANLIFVISAPPGEEEGIPTLMMAGMGVPTLTVDDVEALADIPSVVRVAPLSENMVEIAFGGESLSTFIQSSTPEYQWLFNFSVATGRFISDRDVALRNTVVVLGAQVAEDLFGLDDPIGQRVTIKGERFTVIGVLEVRGMAFMGMSWDDIVVVPITTHQSRLFPIFTARGEDGIQQINAQAASAEVMDEAIEEIRSVLREQRPWLAKDEEDDFTIFTMEEMAGILLQVMGIFTIILGAIASISLLVGGIGIMNIMLISVTERTREIGIRKAVGAKQRDILVQFLIEAATLSLAGGGIGIISGWLLSRLISLIDIGGGQTLQTAVSPDIIILAISVSVFIGLVSGIYPAMKAARQNPIDALRYR